LKELHLKGQIFISPQGLIWTKADVAIGIIRQIPQARRQCIFLVLKRLAGQFGGPAAHVFKGKPPRL
jgi:hypothetical protein